MIARTAVVEEARRWLGTTYQHQQHTRGDSTDCIGLVAGVALAVGALPADSWQTSFAPYAGYGRQPALGLLESVCDAFMQRVPIAEAQHGDVLAFRFRRETMHLGIMVPYVHGGDAVIHALASAGEVVEHRLDGKWRSRLTIVWRMPGVA